MSTVSAGFSLAAGLALTDLGVQTLWGRYVALGGSHTRHDLALYLGGQGSWTSHEHNIVAPAVNQYTSERGLDHPAPYSQELQPGSWGLRWDGQHGGSLPDTTAVKEVFVTRSDCDACRRGSAHLRCR